MIGSLLAGHYRVIDKLGAGGFGQTYIVEDIHRPGNPQCVVKHLKPASNHPQVLEAASELFKKEAKILEELGKHPQIPQLLAYFEEKKEFYLVQELIVGHSLDKEIAPGKSLSDAYVIPLLHDILETLAFVHQHRVIHRDIKPQNLIRRKEDDKIVLIDFGAVKEIATTQVVTRGQATLSLAVGTPGYMPSEQTQGCPRYSSDIYAVGVLGIFALTGIMPDQLPQDRDSGEIVWRNRIQGTVRDELLDVLDQMVRYDFRQRYRSAVKALSVLQELFSGSVLQSTIPAQNITTQPVNSPRNTLTQPTKPVQSAAVPPLSVPSQYSVEILSQAQPSAATRQTQQTQAWGFFLDSTLVSIVSFVQRITDSPQFPQASSATAQAQSKKAGWGFFLQWVLASMIGFVLGISGHFFGGVILGIMQWFVLRRWVRPAWWWIVVTTVGFVLGFAVVFPLALMSNSVVVFLFSLAGAVFGIAQWLVLRQWVSPAWWWIVASAMSGAFLFIPYPFITGALLVWLLRRSSATKQP